MNKGKNAKSDIRKGTARYIDQQGQWTNKTPAATRKRQDAAMKKLYAMLEKKSTTKKKR